MKGSARLRDGLVLASLFFATGCRRDISYWKDLWPQETHADGGRFAKYPRELVHFDLDPKAYVSCTAADLRREPARWRNVPVKLKGVFNVTHEAAVQFYTRYTPNSHMGFSAWDPKTRLWIPVEREKGHALFFVRWGSPLVKEIENLPPYQPVMIYGVGTDVLDQGICLDVERMEALSGPRYTEEVLVTLKTADEAFAAQDWPVAREAYKKAAAVVMPDEGLAHAYAGWADSAERQGIWSEAAVAFDKSCGFDPESWEKAWGAGRCHLRLEAWSIAADRLDRCDALLPRAAEKPAAWRDIQLSRATAHAQSGRLSAAAPIFEALIEADPRDGAALNNYAYALLAEGKDKEKALGLARRAADLLGERVHALFTLGWANLENGNGADAVIALRKAHEAAPTDAEIAFRYGQALARTGKPVLAKAVLGQVVRAESRWSGRAEDLIRSIDAEEKKLLEVN